MLTDLSFVQLGAREEELNKALKFLDAEAKKVDYHQENINRISFIRELVLMEIREINVLKNKPIKNLGGK